MVRAPALRGAVHAPDLPTTPSPLARTRPEDRPAEAQPLFPGYLSGFRLGQTIVTRAVNVDAAIAHVIATSARLKAVISAIEPLVPSGTRVVFVNADDAAAVSRAYGSKVLTGAVTRNHWAQRRVS
jgi:hypothetical protein